MIVRASMSSFQKWCHVGLVSAAGLLAMTLWFSASAVVPQLTSEWSLSASQKSWMTMSVQLGFVLGAVLSALINLADRTSAARLLGASALAGAVANAAIPLLASSPAPAIVLRLLTGVALAGVYPPTMKVISTWCRQDRGLGIGLLVGSLTLGSAMPHLLNVLPFSGESGIPPWRSVLWTTSMLSTVAGFIGLFVIRAGPFLDQAAPFNWRFAGRVLAHKPTRLANFGYLGHMWELYAMWTWAPIFIMASYQRADWSLWAARVAGFSAIAMGALGCVAAGIIADRFGRTAVTGWSLGLSGSCALVVGFFFATPGILTALCLLWGFSVVADSAQFSAAVSELTDSRYVGTALTLQTALGFLLTLLTIRIIPWLADLVGWEHGFAILAIGPVFGIWSMLRLRRMRDSLLMASGHR
jgi:MFS family permease